MVRLEGMVKESGDPPSREIFMEEIWLI